MPFGGVHNELALSSLSHLHLLPTWVWVKIKPPGHRRLESTFPFNRVTHFGVTLFLTTTAKLLCLGGGGIHLKHRTALQSFFGSSLGHRQMPPTAGGTHDTRPTCRVRSGSLVFLRKMGQNMAVAQKESPKWNLGIGQQRLKPAVLPQRFEHSEALRQQKDTPGSPKMVLKHNTAPICWQSMTDCNTSPKSPRARLEVLEPRKQSQHGRHLPTQLHHLQHHPDERTLPLPLGTPGPCLTRGANVPLRQGVQPESQDGLPCAKPREKTEGGGD